MLYDVKSFYNFVLQSPAWSAILFFSDTSTRANQKIIFEVNYLYITLSFNSQIYDTIMTEKKKIAKE